MAITIVSQPSSPQLIGNEICFTFQLTETVVGNITKRFGYQLFVAGTANNVTEEELVLPQPLTDFPVNFMEDLLTYVSTNYPDPSAKRAEPEMFATFELKIWEYHYNTDTCSGTIENEQTLPAFTVLNMANQYYARPIKASANTWLHTDYPNVSILCKDETTWVYAYTENTGNIIIANLFEKDGTPIASPLLSASFEDGAWSYPINHQQLADLMEAIIPLGPGVYEELIHSVEVTVDANPIVRFYFEDCCTEDNVHIYWQSALGGYKSMNFDRAEDLRIQTTYSEICRFQPKTITGSNEPDNVTIRNVGGTSINNKVSNRTFVLSKVLTQNEADDLRQYEDFLASGSYYMKYLHTNGSIKNSQTLSYSTIKFLPKSGSLRYYKAEDEFRLLMSGKLNQTQRMPNYAT